MALADKLRYLLNTKTAIKEAIESKGETVPENTTFKGFADLIKSIITVKNQNKTQSITTNGTVTVKPDAGYTGLGQVTITTNINTVKNQNKTQSITGNGTVTVKPDSGYTGLGQVTINTNVQKTLTGAGATSAGGTANSRSTAVSAPPGVSMLIITCVANRAEALGTPAVSGTNITLNTRDAIHSGRIENADIDTTIMKTWACRITNSATAARTVNISWTNDRAVILAASIVKQ